MVSEMNVRQNSIETYNKIKENGLLSKSRWQVYDVLYRHGPLTKNEISKQMRVEGIVLNSNLVSSRLTQMRELGTVYEVKRQRLCSVSGNMIIEWDVTDREPIKFEKPHKVTCTRCNGRGFIEETQSKFTI